MFRNLFHRFFQPLEAQQPASQVLPLPCPVHGAILVSEAGENGCWSFYCPVCRLLNQPVVRQPETEPLQLEKRPSQLLKPGKLLHAHNAQKRFLERLSRNRLVLNEEFDGNSRPQDTDALSFANALTEERPVVVKRAVG